MAEAQALSFGEGRAQRKNLTTAFDQLIDLQQAKAERYHQDAQKFMKMFELTAFLILIGMIIFCLAFAVFQARTLLKPIEQMTKELREGNVYQKQAAKDFSADEIGELLQAFYYLEEKLRCMVQEIQEAAEQTASASEELTASAAASLDMTKSISESSSGVVVAVRQQQKEVDNLDQSGKQPGACQYCQYVAAIRTSFYERKINGRVVVCCSALYSKTEDKGKNPSSSVWVSCFSSAGPTVWGRNVCWRRHIRACLM